MCFVVVGLFGVCHFSVLSFWGRDFSCFWFCVVVFLVPGVSGVGCVFLVAFVISLVIRHIWFLDTGKMTRFWSIFGVSRVFYWVYFVIFGVFGPFLVPFCVVLGMGYLGYVTVLCYICPNNN